MRMRWLSLLLLVILCSFLLTSSCSAKPSKGATREMYYGTGRLISRNNVTDAKCATYTDCGQCTDDSNCVWCSVGSYCRSGGFSGADCDGWMYGQCANDGLALLVGVGIIIALAILILLAIAFCCVFCRRSTASYEVMDDEAQPSSTGPTSAHPITDQHRQDMEAKYGLGSTQPRTEIDA